MAEEEDEEDEVEVAGRKSKTGIAERSKTGSPRQNGARKRDRGNVRRREGRR